MRGADLRGSGSGNPGATNAARAMGVQVGVMVGVLDVAKGFAPVMFFNRYGEPCGEVAGIAAVLGHVTSPLLKGKGGKGVATSLGAILAIEPLWAIPVLVSFGATVALTRQVGIGSVVGSADAAADVVRHLAGLGRGRLRRRDVRAGRVPPPQEHPVVRGHAARLRVGRHRRPVPPERGRRPSWVAGRPQMLTGRVPDRPPPP